MSGTEHKEPYDESLKRYIIPVEIHPEETDITPSLQHYR